MDTEAKLNKVLRNHDVHIYDYDNGLVLVEVDWGECAAQDERKQEQENLAKAREALLGAGYDVSNINNELGQSFVTVK